jgi:peroxiredoxin (alkyl hydroperoxide reductase subunit C)
MSIRPGLAAPDFEAQAYANGAFQKVKLSDYKGKWVVLFFYPADFTFVCPTELTAVGARYDELKKLGVEVLSVSVDTVFVHKAWQEAELSKMLPGGLPYPMVSDISQKIGKDYGVFDEKLNLHLRGVFVIDPDGVIQASQILNAPVGRDVDELIREIQAFQYVREAKGTEVCPSGWRPGKATLKQPGAGMVGKVHEAWKVEKK